MRSLGRAPCRALRELRREPLAVPLAEPDSVSGVQLARVTEKLNGVTDGGRRKLNRWSAGKRSAVPHFQPYRTRISSHNLPVATVCIKYAAHMLSICIYNYRYTEWLIGGCICQAYAMFFIIIKIVGVYLPTKIYCGS